MKVLGAVLIIGGLLALIYGGFSYTKQHKVLDVGALQARVDEKKTVAVPPLVGGIALVAGVVLLVASRRRA